MGVIEDSIFANYKKALEEGNFDQARKAVSLIQELKKRIESGEFLDYSIDWSPGPTRRYESFNPFPYRYYPDQGIVVFGNSAIRLTPTENQLFGLFSENESSGNTIKVISKKAIMKCLWENKRVTQNALRIAILRLREKIEPDYKNPKVVIKSYARGYIFLGKREPDESQNIE